MRITFLSPVGEVGGAERVMLGLIAHLNRDHQVSAVLMADGPLAALIRSLGVPVEVMPLPAAWQSMGDSQPVMRTLLCGALRTPFYYWQLRGYVRRLQARLEALQPDIVHSNGMKAHLIGAWSKPRDARLIWHVHDYVGRRRLGRRLLRAASSRATAAVAVSRSVAVDLQRSLPRLHVVTVANFVDARHFRPGEAAGVLLDERAGLTPAATDVLRLGLVATYAVWKGHRLFLDALRGIVDVLGDQHIRGYIIGGPIYRTDRSQVTEADLRRQIAELGLTACVGLVPFQSDPRDAYRSLDVVVHASTQPEPFGLTIAEAMACGKAVAVARAGGAEEIVTDGENGRLYQAGDARSLVETLLVMVGDPELRSRLGRRARITIEEEFNVETAVEKLLAVYRECASQ